MNFKHTAKVGSTISFHVLRKGKKIHVHENLHNQFLHSALYSRFDLNSFLDNTFVLSSDLANLHTVLNDSEWQQVGTLISRTSGTEKITDAFNPSSSGKGAVFWPNGDFGGYITDQNTTLQTVTTTQSLSKSSQSGLHVFAIAIPALDENQSSSVAVTWGSTQFNANVLSKSSSAKARFPTATSEYELKSLYLADLNSSFYEFAGYTLPTPITILVGDQIVIESITYTLTFDTIAPVAFPSNTITGVASSGVVQKLLPVNIGFEDANVDFTRAYFVKTANAVTVPAEIPAIGTADILPATITATYTATATSATDVSSEAANSFLSGQRFYIGSIVGSHTDIKQIYLGNTTRLAAVIEFDSPRNFNAGTTLTLVVGTRTAPDYPAIP